MKQVDLRTQGKIRGEIVQAIPSANIDELALIIGDHTNRTVLHRITRADTFELQVRRVIQLANAEGWLPELIAAMREEKPQVPAFGTFLVEINGAVPVSAPVATLQQVLPGSALTHFATLERRMRAVCRIDYADRTPPGAGTGFLVGPNRVLTNHHVARRAIDSPNAIAQLRLRFDLRDAASAADGSGRECRARNEGAVLRSSPPGGVEVSGAGEPSAAELDYALIELAEAPADDAVAGGERRGHMTITPDMAAPRAAGSIIAIQHPMRGELQFAIGVIDGPNESGSRIRHNAATLEGSSGSPILDVALSPALLHNGTRPGSAAEREPYNTGVPMKLIAADLAAHGLA